MLSVGGEGNNHYISETTRPDFTKCSMLVACDRGSILFRQRCVTLCADGFADDVMFSYTID